jgi:hypothetical protein
MYVAINPLKIKSFTTKGIHITISRPVCFVPEGLEQEFMDKIETAISNNELLLVADDSGILLPGFGQTSKVEVEEELKGNYTISKQQKDEDIREVTDPFGDVRRMRKVMYTLTLPKEEEEPTGIITARS